MPIITIHSPDRDNVLIAGAYEISNEQFDRIRAIIYSDPTPPGIPKFRVIADILNERAGPGANFPVIQRRKRGDIVEVEEKKGGWAKKAQAGGGWLSLTWLEPV